MMKSLILSPQTPLQKERLLFRELLARLINTILNKLFDLRPEKAARRMRYLILLFFFSGFLVTLRYYPLGLWARHIQDIFLYLFNPGYAANYDGDPFTKLILFAFEAFADPRTLQYLPIFLAPFFIAFQSAAIYLADIFELENVSVARKFVSEVALSGSDETIRITAGEVSDESRQSPNYLIGGPGKVIVDLDSVALFEKPDGTPHIIGPTGKEQRGKATLEGFERFCQAIDLRDHFIDLRDQDDKSPSVRSRTLDGIPITATDVRLMFSVHRNGQRPSTEHPYPFSEKAIEQLVYKSTSRVTPDLANASTYEFSWVNNMIGLIRGKLGGFMSERNLTVFLASIGIPEFEKAKQREEEIAKQARQLTPPTENPPKVREVKPPPEFKPRYEITNLFAQFVGEFTKSARDRGVELHWIGVGTWKTPVENISEEHLEAWKITRDNISRGNEGVMQNLRSQAELHRTLALIQSVPLSAFEEAKTQYSDHMDVIKSVLLEYQRLLKDQFEVLSKNKQHIKPILVAAIFHIDNLISHKLYPPPPEPASAREKEVYRDLRARISSSEAIEKLVELESETDPQASRLELLEHILQEWDREIGDVNIRSPRSGHWVGDPQ